MKKLIIIFAILSYVSSKDIQIVEPKVSYNSDVKVTPIDMSKILKQDDFYNTINLGLNKMAGSGWIRVGAQAIPAPKTVASTRNFRFDLQQSQSEKVDSYQIQINKESTLFKQGQPSTVCGFVLQKPTSKSQEVYLFKINAVKAAIYYACKRKQIAIIQKS